MGKQIQKQKSTKKKEDDPIDKRSPSGKPTVH